MTGEKFFECYNCGKKNKGKFFCNSVCHEEWAKNNIKGTKKRTLAELQEVFRVYSARRKGLEVNLDRDITDMSEKEMINLFS